VADRSTSVGQSEKMLCRQLFLIWYEEQSTEMSQTILVSVGVYIYMSNSCVR